MSHSTTEPGRWTGLEWQPDFLHTFAAEQPVSASAGLSQLLKLFTETQPFSRLKHCLPVSNSSYHPSHMVMMILAGFWLGYDCLDDLEKMRDDPVALSLFGEIPCAKTFGNFLRDFETEQLCALRAFLTIQSLTFRWLLDKAEKIEFSIDSTDHPHHGDLIEGLEFNYKGHWCLDSLEVFDELGFCYDFDLRPGATFSSVGAVAMMNKVMDHRPLLPSAKADIIHADSAYCSEEFIRMCLLRRLKGTITAHDNIRWTSEIDRITTWQPWVFTEEEIERSVLSNTPLPKIEVGFYMYSPAWAEGKIIFPVVVKRTHKSFERLSKKKRAEMIKAGQNPRQGLWEHYAVVSLMGLHPHTPQQIIESHQVRSNMENMIKEGKIGFDLRHFPCRKMNANHAYALLGMIAHNFFRLLALLDNPKHPQFAKALRYRFVNIPGRIVKGQGKKYLRLNVNHFKEVHRLTERWVATCKPPRSTA